MDYSNYGEVYQKYDLFNDNTYRVHSVCDYFIKVNDVVKLTNLIKLLEDNKIKYFIIGNGSNIILKSHYNGVVIKLSLNDIKLNKNSLIIGASVNLTNLSLFCANNNLKGMEFACGIPGTIGAAVITNAGAYGSSIGEFVKEIEVLENNHIKILKKNELIFSYRNSNLKTRSLIILSVTLELINGRKEDILNLRKEYTKKRINSQDLTYPSAGSVFCNPEGDYAGRIIESLGLKGKVMGGAKVSDKHANFIVNYNNATGGDIINLIEFIKEEVRKKLNIELSLEQVVIE